MSIPRINPDRFWGDFQTLSKIGATPQGGVSRPAFSQAHSEARAWFRERVAEAGLELRVDGAGNHSAVLPQPGADRTLLLGSHLDSVPDGGRFDGALGVLAALEVLRTIKEANSILNVHLEAIDFTDEESNLVEYLGSRALTGVLTVEDLQSPMGGRLQFVHALETNRMAENNFWNARRNPQTLAGYLELHIEQGPVLAAEKIPIGIVNGIVGIRAFQISFLGKANHSGTTPMLARLDALQAASAFALGVREITVNQYPDCVANVGNMFIKPGAFNVVPGRVDVLLEFRSVHSDSLERLEGSLLTRAQIEAEKYQLGLEVQRFSPSSPVHMNKNFQAAIKRAAENHGLAWKEMPSGAGHDAQVMAEITPCGMIFVPSQAGISHSPLEVTSKEDCVNGANVLLGAALQLAST